jgi:hypothetical protein
MVQEQISYEEKRELAKELQQKQVGVSPSLTSTVDSDPVRCRSLLLQRTVQHVLLPVSL